MNELKSLREQIDKLDKKMTELFEERMDLSKKVAQVKKENKINIFNAAREEEVIKKNISYLKNPEYSFILEGYYRNLMNLSKIIQNNEKHN